MNRDENDRLKDGTLPKDPFSDVEKVSDEVPRILTVRELIVGAGDRALSGKRSRGCTSGVHQLDEITGGFKPGFVWVFGADTSWGKSSFLVMLTDENIKAGKRVLIVSAEDSEQLYGDRLLIRRSKVRATAFSRGQLDREEKSRITEAMRKSEDIPVFLDGRGKSVEWITKRVKEIIKEHQIDLVAFDYLQAFDNEKHQQDRRNQVTYISRVLTDAIKTSNATGVIFSQLTVQPNKTHPDKHSIRESRDVSNAAEVIVLGFTPEKPIADSRGNVLVEAQQKCIFVDKCKDGPRGAVIGMDWNSESACFETIVSPEQARYNEVTGGEFDEFGDQF